MSSHSKLREAKAALGDFMRAQDADGIRRAFAAVVGSIRTAAQAMRTESLEGASGQRDASKLKRELRDWWDREHQRQMGDDVLRWVLKARNSDTHGDTADALAVSFERHAKVAWGAPVDGAEIADGMMIWNRNTPDERRQPISGIQQFRYSSTAIGKLETHLGQPIRGRNAPHQVLEMAIRYYTRLWYAVQDDPRKSGWEDGWGALTVDDYEEGDLLAAGPPQWSRDEGLIEIAGKTVRPLEYVSMDPHGIRGVHFVDCQIMGPAVFYSLSSALIDCTFDAPTPNSIVLSLNDPEYVVGAIPIHEVRFTRCRFQSISWVVEPQNAARWIEGFRQGSFAPSQADTDDRPGGQPVADPVVNEPATPRESQRPGEQ